MSIKHASAKEHLAILKENTTLKKGKERAVKLGIDFILFAEVKIL